MTPEAPRRFAFSCELLRPGGVDLDRHDVAREHRRLPAGGSAQVERPLPEPRADDVADELRAAALRPDAALRKRGLVDAVDDERAVDQRILSSLDRAAHEPDRGLRLLVLRRHQRARSVGAEVAPPRVRDPVRVRVPERRLLRRALGERGAQLARAVREAPQDRVRERHRPLQPRAPDELDRLVDRGVAWDAVHERELVRAETERGQDGRVDLPHGALADRLDRVVERPLPLDRAVREATGERAVAVIQRTGLGAQDAVGVRVVLEHPPQNGECDPPRRRDRAHRSPRRHASTDIRFPPSGWTSSGSNVPSGATRARQTVTGRPLELGPRADVRAERPDDADELLGRAGEVELSVGGADLLGVRRLAGLRRERRSPVEDAVEEPDGDLGRTAVDEPRVVLGPDRERLAGRHRTGVELRHGLVDGHAGLGVPGHDRPLDRCGAPPAREQRRMDVQPRALREQAVGNEQPVGADDDGRRIEVEARRGALGLQDGDGEALRHLLRGRRSEPAAAAGRSVRPREQDGDVVASGESLEHVRAERCRRGDRDAGHASRRGRAGGAAAGAPRGARPDPCGR